MLWSIDSCQNRVSADQYNMTVSRAQVSTHWDYVFFFMLSVDKLPVLYWLQALTSSGFCCNGYKFITVDSWKKFRVIGSLSYWELEENSRE